MESSSMIYPPAACHLPLNRAHLQEEPMHPQVLRQLRMERRQQEIPVAEEDRVRSVLPQDLELGIPLRLEPGRADEDAEVGLSPEAEREQLLEALALSSVGV